MPPDLDVARLEIVCTVRYRGFESLSLLSLPRTSLVPRLLDRSRFGSERRVALPARSERGRGGTERARRANAPRSRCRTIGNRVYREVPRVRIPLSPPSTENVARSSAFGSIALR